MLGVEPKRVGVQVRDHGLRRWRPRRDRLRHVSTGLLDGPRPPTGKDDDQFPPSQRLADRARDNLSLVRMARLQRRIRVRCQPQGCHGLLEYQSCCYVCRCDLGASRFQVGEEMVDGRVVLGCHFGPGCSNTGVRVHHALGRDHSGGVHRRPLQLCNKRYTSQ